MPAIVTSVPVVPQEPVLPPVVNDGHLLVPQASPTCPAFGGGDAGGGIDWNPIDHVPLLGDAKKVAESIGTIVGKVLDWIYAPSDMAHDIVGWLTWNSVGYNPDAPGCYQPTSTYGFARGVVAGDVELGSSSFYSEAYGALADFAVVLILVAVVARVVRAGADPEANTMRVAAESFLRGVVGIASVQLGFAILAWVLPVVTELAASMFWTLAALSVSDLQGFDPLGVLLFLGLRSMASLQLVGLVLIPVLLYQLVRVVLLMVLRFVVLSLGIAAAPVIIAIAVFDSRNALVRWYAGLLLGAAIAPLVLAFCIGITIGLALHAAAGTGGGDQSYSPLVGVIVVIGGCWLTSRALRACLYGFSGHHSPSRLLRTAVEAAILVPASVAGVAGVGAVLASGAGRASGVMQALSWSGPGRGFVWAAMRGNNPLSRAAGLQFHESPTQALQAFRASDAGTRFISEVTAGRISPQATPGQRWAAVERLPGMESAIRQLRTGLHAESARTGRLAVPPQTWGAFDDAFQRAMSRGGTLNADDAEKDTAARPLSAGAPA